MSEPILVLGMHRSGTSSVAGALTKLGGGTPHTPMPPNDSNVRGFFESTPIVNFNDELLASAGSSWDDWRGFNSAWFHSIEAETFRRRAADLFRSEFDGSSLPVFKDPRICRFAPFWIDLFKGLGQQPRIVIPIRSPLEVAKSLREIHGMPLSKALLLWLRHVLDAEAASRNEPRSVFTWDQFLADWRGTTEKISSEAGIVWPRLSDQSGYEIERFIGRELVHQRVAPADLAKHSKVHEWTLAAYDAMLRLADNPFSNSAIESLNQIKEEFDRACAMFGPVLVDYEIQAEEFKARLAELAGRDDFSAALAHAEVKLEELGAENARLAADLGDRDARLVAAEAAMDEAQIERQKLSDALARAEKWAGGVSADLDRASTEKEQLAAALAEREASLASAEAALNEARGERQKLSDALQQTEKRAAGLSADLGQVCAEKDQLAAALAEREASLAAAEAAADEARIERQKLIDALARAEKWAGRFSADLSRVSAEKDQLAAALAEREASLAAAETAADEARVERQIVGDALADAENWAAGLSADLGRVSAEKDQLAIALAERDASLATLDMAVEKANLAAAAALNENERLFTGLAERQRLLSAAEERLQELELRLHDASAERDRRAAAAARAEEIRSRNEKEAAARAAALEAAHAAALAGAQQSAEGQIRAISARLVETEARLAKAERSGSARGVWRRLLNAATSRSDIRLLRKSGVFDEAWYKAEFLDGAQSQTSPVEHFLEEGYLRGCKPNPFFDPLWYLEQYPDVRHSGLNPLVHYLRHGVREGRDPSPQFKTEYYLSSNPDVRDSGENPLAHFLLHGRHEGRRPAPNFDATQNWLVRGRRLG